MATLALESPFYGRRRPPAQRGAKLLHVADLLTLGWATIAESLTLLHWMEQEGYSDRGGGGGGWGVRGGWTTGWVDVGFFLGNAADAENKRGGEGQGCLLLGGRGGGQEGGVCPFPWTLSHTLACPHTIPAPTTER